MNIFSKGVAASIGLLLGIFFLTGCDDGDDGGQKKSNAVTITEVNTTELDGGGHRLAMEVVTNGSSGSGFKIATIYYDGEELPDARVGEGKETNIYGGKQDLLCYTRQLVTSDFTGHVICLQSSQVENNSPWEFSTEAMGEVGPNADYTLRIVFAEEPGASDIPVEIEFSIDSATLEFSGDLLDEK